MRIMVPMLEKGAWVPLSKPIQQVPRNHEYLLPCFLVNKAFYSFDRNLSYYI